MQQAIEKAVAILRAGGLVAFPTETVYGLGADASNVAAVQKVFSVKKRPSDHPLIVHLSEAAQLTDWAVAIPQTAYQLAAAFWPGPLTLVLKRQPHVADIVTGGQETVGIRIPRHPVAQALLAQFGSGVVAPSANQFTHISPTTAAAVEEELGNQIDLILDGGACAVGLESTIVDLSGNEPVILRPGMITHADISSVLGMPVLSRSIHASQRAPGMHHLHYAPQTTTHLLALEEIAEALKQSSASQRPVAVVHYSEWSAPAGVTGVKLASSPTQYAHDLYHTLRELDHQLLKCIFIEAVPAGAAWEAIRDRLTKASAIRSETGR